MKRDRQQQEILGEAVRNAFLKLDPRIQWKNPVMFIVFLGDFSSSSGCTCFYGRQYTGRLV